MKPSSLFTKPASSITIALGGTMAVALSTLEGGTEEVEGLVDAKSGTLMPYSSAYLKRRRRRHDLDDGSRGLCSSLPRCRGSASRRDHIFDYPCRQCRDLSPFYLPGLPQPSWGLFSDSP